MHYQGDLYCAVFSALSDEGVSTPDPAVGHCVLLAAEERLFARTIEFGGRLKPDRVERNSFIIYV
jgi:hypothetical protein